jgi:hypothetical protein
VIAAVAKNTPPLSKVEEFRIALSPAEAVTLFVNEYNPPLDPADYVGVDTGWSAVQTPAEGFVWAYDFAAAALVQASSQDFLDLAQLKELRWKQIDTRTNELIAQGFVFGGVVLSLSLTAQLRVEALDRVRNEVFVVYPIVWNSIDDSLAVSVANAAELHTLYLTALGTIRARVDSGSVLKEAVRAAVTKAEVDAVVDNRV